MLLQLGYIVESVEIYRTIAPQDADKVIRDAITNIILPGSGAVAKAVSKAGKGLRRAGKSLKRLRKASPKRAAGKSPCKKSFAQDTEVVMCDGSSKKIKDVKKGDKVLSKDPKTGEMAGKVVV